LLALFRTNQLIVHIAVLLYLGILWLPAYLSGDSGQEEGAGFITRWLWSVLPSEKGFLLSLAIVLVWLQGLVLNFLVQEYRMGPQITLFSGVALAWFCSAAPEFTSFNALLVGNTFLVFALHQAYALYRHPQPAAALFNVGFLFSLAALSYFPFAVLVPLGWFLLGIQRGHRLDETLQYLVGAALPWFLLFVIWYWAAPEETFSLVAGIPESWPAQWIGPVGARLPLAALLLTTLIVFLLTRSVSLKLGETMQVQKNIDLACLLLLGGGCSLLLAGPLPFQHLLICALPAALLMGLWLGRLSSRWAETIHFLFFAAALIYQYFPLL